MSATMSTDQQPYLVVDSPHEVANWRPLVHWLMFIPHGIILYALRIVSQVCFFIYWLILIFTGKLNPGLYGVMAMYERYNTRATGFLLGFTEIYAPFDFNTGGADNGAYPPISLRLPEPPETMERKRAFNIFLAIPHYIVIAIFGIAAAVVAILGWFAVLFTGRWPEGMRAFLVRFSNYYYRVWTYAAMIENQYPRFGLPAA